MEMFFFLMPLATLSYKITFTESLCHPTEPEKPARYKKASRVKATLCEDRLSGFGPAVNVGVVYSLAEEHKHSVVECLNMKTLAAPKDPATYSEEFRSSRKIQTRKHSLTEAISDLVTESVWSGNMPSRTNQHWYAVSSRCKPACDGDQTAA